MSTLGSSRVLSLRALVPKSGQWHADVVLETGDVPSGRATLTIGKDASALALVGSVLRAGLNAPGQAHAVVIGGAGWLADVTTPMAYQSDAGVKLSTILRDVSRLANEPLELPADRPIGTAFAIPASTSSGPVRLCDVISMLQSRGYVDSWRVDPDGVTRFGARASSTVTGRATVMRRNPAVGVAIVGLDDPAQFLPGATVPDVGVARRVILVETSGKLQAEVYT